MICSDGICLVVHGAPDGLLRSGIALLRGADQHFPRLVATPATRRRPLPADTRPARHICRAPRARSGPGIVGPSRYSRTSNRTSAARQLHRLNRTAEPPAATREIREDHVLARSGAPRARHRRRRGRDGPRRAGLARRRGRRELDHGRAGRRAGRPGAGGVGAHRGPVEGPGRVLGAGRLPERRARVGADLAEVADPGQRRRGRGGDRVDAAAGRPPRRRRRAGPCGGLRVVGPAGVRVERRAARRLPRRRR